MKKINFTDEELLYIEKLMDINASYGGDKITKAIETFMLSKSMGNEEHCKLLAQTIMELGEAQLITKSIRDKIEKWR